MNLLIIGDIHGCFNTFKTLLDKHWKSDAEILIQLGDLIDRGNFSAETLLLAHSLNQNNNMKTFF